MVYICVRNCFTYPPQGGAMRLYKEGDLVDFPEGAEVPRHFVSKADVKEKLEPRLDSKDQRYGTKLPHLAPVKAPVDKDYAFKMGKKKQ